VAALQARQAARLLTVAGGGAGGLAGRLARGLTGLPARVRARLEAGGLAGVHAAMAGAGLQARVHAGDVARAAGWQARVAGGVVARVRTGVAGSLRARMYARHDGRGLVRQHRSVAVLEGSGVEGFDGERVEVELQLGHDGFSGRSVDEGSRTC